MTSHSDATIVALRVRPVLVPLPEPHQTASGILSVSPLVLVDITGSDGVTGHSIVFTFSPTALGPTASLISNLEELLIKQPLDPAAIRAMLTQRFRLLGTEGIVAMALAGIDMALWDAVARTNKSTVAEFCGATLRSHRAYAVIGFDGPGDSAAVAEKWVRQGFTGVKARVGYPTVEDDRDVIRAIRGAVGDDIAIMVDYNQSLSVEEAVKRMEVLDEEGLAWVEEPVLAQDFIGHAKVTNAAETPIQSGENWWGPLAVQQAITANASDLIMPDAMKIGGVSGWLEACNLGEQDKIPLSTHLWPELNAQLLCLAPTAHWLEYNDWWSVVIADPLQIRDGESVIDGFCGSGIDWNETAISRYAA